MSEPSIRLPPTPYTDEVTITGCLDTITWFVKKNAYQGYDYWIRSLDLPPDKIDTRHIRAVNYPMLARTPYKAWASFIGRPFDELAAIPVQLDLIDGSDAEVEAAWKALAANTQQ